MNKGSRFSKLEVRREGEEPEAAAAASPSTAQRFASVDAKAEVPAAPRRVPGAERFGRPEEQVELAERSAELPFLRCAACRVDSSRFATSCETCGAPFDTADQRAFNEGVRLELEAQALQERELKAQREQDLQLQLEEENRRRRQGYEDLAREAGEKARRDLGEPSPEPFAAWQDRIPWWVRAIGVGFGGVVFLFCQGRHHAWLGSLIFAVLLGLCTPRRWWTR